MRGRKLLVGQDELQVLQHYEFLWTMVFRGLRDGSAAEEEDVATNRFPAMLIKSNGRDRESLTTVLPGKGRHGVSALKDVAKDQIFRDKVQNKEKEFEEFTGLTSERTMRVRYPAIPHERPLWEALKRARNAAQVRRVVSRSKYWLKWEWKQRIGDGEYHSVSGILKTLYDYAEEFCNAKLDPRYPTQSDDKRIEYLARVMAGLSLPKRIKPSYADRILREVRHSES